MKPTISQPHEVQGSAAQRLALQGFLCLLYHIRAKFSSIGLWYRIRYLTFCRQQRRIPTKDSRLGLSSACFYPEDGFHAITRCIRLGFRSIEIFTNTFSELEEPFLRRIAAECRANGVTVTSIHPFTSGFEYMLFFSAHKARARESVEFYRKYFHAAAYLGANYTVFHGDAIKAPFFGMDNYCEVLSLLQEAAKSEGCTLAHENVSTARGGNPAFMRELHERFGKGNIKFVFDLKQACRADHDPFDMIDAMGSDIAHVHINDFADGECRLPFAGKLDLPAVISKIESLGYEGKYVIEVYRGNFTHDSEITDSAQALQKSDIFTAR